MRPTYLPNAPVLLPRPPDPLQANLPLLTFISTEGIPKQHPAEASVSDPTDAITVHTGVLNTPSPNFNNSGQNQTILNHKIDASSQVTPTHEFVEHSAVPIKRYEQPNFSGEFNTSEIGAATSEPPPTIHATLPNTHINSFQKLTSNFDRPVQANKSNSTVIAQHPTPPARYIATMNFPDLPIVNPTTVRSNVAETFSPVIPTIQQLNSKFNHHSTHQVKIGSSQPKLLSKQPHNPSRQHCTVNAGTNEGEKPVPPRPSVVPSYATRLRSSQTIEEQGIAISSPVITTKQGLPAVLFKREDFMVKLATKCKYTLIGKFSSTIPKMEVIRNSLTSQLQIKGSCKVTHFNSTHVYIDLENEIDHAIVWNKERIYIQGRLMRLLVWTPTFRPEEETPIAPVWLVLPHLPWHCYTMPFVSKLLEPVGRVLFFDAASIQRTRGSVAKVKIEIDITRPRPPHVWLGFPHEEGDVYGDGRWQEIQYENVPDYCLHCKHQGHNLNSCSIKSRHEQMQSKREEEDDDATASNKRKQKDRQPQTSQKIDEQPVPQRINADTRNREHNPPPVKQNTNIQHGQSQDTNAVKKKDATVLQRQIYVQKSKAEERGVRAVNQDPHDQHLGEPTHQDLLFIQHTEGKKLASASVKYHAITTKNSFDALPESGGEEHIHATVSNEEKKMAAQNKCLDVNDQTSVQIAGLDHLVIKSNRTDVSELKDKHGAEMVTNSCDVALKNAEDKVKQLLNQAVDKGNAPEVSTVSAVHILNSDNLENDQEEQQLHNYRAISSNIAVNNMLGSEIHYDVIGASGVQKLGIKIADNMTSQEVVNGENLHVSSFPDHPTADKGDLHLRGNLHVSSIPHRPNNVCTVTVKHTGEDDAMVISTVKNIGEQNVLQREFSVATAKETTKSWVERSFGKCVSPDKAAEGHQPCTKSINIPAVVDITECATKSYAIASSENANAEGELITLATDAVTDTGNAVLTGEDAITGKEQMTGNAPVIAQVQHTCAATPIAQQPARKNKKSRKHANFPPAIPETSPLIPTSQLEAICKEASSLNRDPGKLVTNAAKDPQLHRKPWNSSQTSLIGQKAPNCRIITLEELQLMGLGDIYRRQEQEEATPPMETPPQQPKREQLARSSKSNSTVGR